jgi:hypothetical protein
VPTSESEGSSSEDDRSEPQEPTGRSSNVDKRAGELESGGEGHSALEGDHEAATKAARHLLEESEARTFDPAVIDPEEEGVIRRSSEETAE